VEEGHNRVSVARFHGAEWIAAEVREFRRLVVILLFLVLNWYVAPEKPGERKDLVLAVAQILGGTALLSGLYFTWRTLQVNREGQITDRFTRAIDQLGKVEDGQKLFEIRVGGIYALERIARESEKDYWPIMEILTAYVRQNAPLPPEAGQERTQDATDEQRAMEGPRGKSEITEPSAPDPDIQAIITILRRRKRYYMHEEPEPLDLSQTNLSVADLTGADLFRADLSEADLIQEQLDQAEGDENTKLPSFLKPPEHWSGKADEQPEES
jgi:pentapeptide repeat protein